MQKIVVANWKMNGNFELAKELTSVLKLKSYELDTKIVIAPPSVLIPFVAMKLKHNPELGLAAQDVSAHDKGAYTGEVSGSMLKEAGCGYVMIGHSERRAYHAETTELVMEKMAEALAAGLTPIVCIGENLEDRQANNTETVLAAQLDPILKKYKAAFMLAYEPVWAIGTGVAAKVDEIKSTHAFLKKKLYNCADVPLLYGGSVNAGNALTILSCKDVDGVLVGGASLKANEIAEICEAAHEAGQ